MESGNIVKFVTLFAYGQWACKPTASHSDHRELCLCPFWQILELRSASSREVREVSPKMWSFPGPLESPLFWEPRCHYCSSEAGWWISPTQRTRKKERKRERERWVGYDDFSQKETTPGIVRCHKLWEGNPPILQHDAEREKKWRETQAILLINAIELREHALA